MSEKRSLFEPLVTMSDEYRVALERSRFYDDEAKRMLEQFHGALVDAAVKALPDSVWIDLLIKDTAES